VLFKVGFCSISAIEAPKAIAAERPRPQEGRDIRNGVEVSIVQEQPELSVESIVVALVN
jgi:hypothetical protein